MLEFNEIKNYFPEVVHSNKKSIIREYLQCKVLRLIFQSRVSGKLTFIGGTALRLIYNTQRFSEDLDFDNKDLTIEDWNELGNYIQKELKLENINVDIARARLDDTVFHHNLRFPGLLFEYQATPHKNEVLLIRANSENQNIEYRSEIHRLNKFEINSRVKVMPLDVALSQKFRAFFDREMGRDLFDISSIAPKTKPNYQYLESALGIRTPKELKEKVLARCQDFNFDKISDRTLPFLFNQEDISRILYFKEYMQQYEF